MGSPCVQRPFYIGRRAASLLRNCDRPLGPVRGTDEAGGNAPELPGCGPRPCPDRARALAGDVAEGASECSQTFPAGVEGYLGDGPIGVAEQCRGALYAPREQVTMRRYAKGLF